MIDEDTALVLSGSAAEVLGVGTVAVVDPARDARKPYLSLKAGDKRDVASMREE